MASYRLKKIGPTTHRISVSRKKVGSIWVVPNGGWRAKLTMHGETFIAQGDNPSDLFDLVVTQANRVHLGVDRHDADGAAAVMNARNAAVSERVAEMNRFARENGLPETHRVRNGRILC